jgi:hypothetical protein
MKKFTKTINLIDVEVLTDSGWKDIKSIHTTVPYEIFRIELADGSKLECADTHIVFNEEMVETYIKDLNIGDSIITDNGTSTVENIYKTGKSVEMFDLELTDDSDHRYYTNGILSHNTELAKQLAKFMFDSEDALIRIDMTEYGEKFNASKLMGAPPGFVGYEEGGQLTEKVKRKPYSVILLDEVEKAHPDIFHTLLQVLDEGHMTDGLGRKIDFKNTVIIMTSNLGVKDLQDFGTSIGFSNSSDNGEKQKSAAESILKKAVSKQFAPEFINRLDDIITFDSLSKEDICKIVELELNDLYERVKENGYTVELNKQAKDFLVEKGYDSKFGARPLKRVIQNQVEDLIAEAYIDGKIKEGDHLVITYKAKDEKLSIK